MNESAAPPAASHSSDQFVGDAGWATRRWSEGRYNVQLNNIVLGLETDLQWPNGNAEFSVDSTNPLHPTVTTSAAHEMNMLLIVRGRVGATGGLAVADATLN